MIGTRCFWTSRLVGAIASVMVVLSGLVGCSSSTTGSPVGVAQAANRSAKPPAGELNVPAGPDKSAPARDRSTQPLDKSPATQATRKSFIESQAMNGYFEKISADHSPPRLFVTQRFLLLDDGAKRGYVKCVYEYLFDGSKADDVVAIWDGSANREVGRFQRDRLTMNR